MAKRESLWGSDKFPDYRIDLEPQPGRVSVRAGGVTIAQSVNALRVLEAKHDPVLYLPREEVRMELLERTEHETFCPFKGEASYYSIRAGDRLIENAVWTYEDPFEEVAGIKDLLAFYPDRVELSTEP